MTLSLLDLKEKTPNEISKEIIETRNDVQVALQELRSQGLVKERAEGELENSFTITQNIEGLVKLAKKFTNTDNEYEFMLSHFIGSIVDDNFIKHVADRFKLNLSQQQRKSLLTVSRIFPSVLEFELFGDVKAYENSHRQLLESGLSESEKIKLHQSVVTAFLGRILVRSVDDIRNAPAGYLDKKGIRGYQARYTLRVATNTGLIFDQEYKDSEYLAVAGGTIKAGEMVSGDPVVLFNMGVTLMDLKEYDEAASYFEKLVDVSSDPKVLTAAWNNKGLCFLRMTNFEYALKCFEKVLSFDPKHVEALNNTAICLESLGRVKEAKEIRERIQSSN